jgi:putative nucleotidyltransferase with HDIG domain
LHRKKLPRLEQITLKAVTGLYNNFINALKFKKGMIQVKSLFEEINQYVFNLFKEKLSHQYVYHNYQHTLETAEGAEKLAKECGLEGEDLEVLMIAAWFHDTGYIHSYADHEEKSIEIARVFLEEKNYPVSKMNKVAKCIEATKREIIPSSLSEQILCDADIVNIGDKNFSSKADLLRDEWENFQIRSCNEIEWAETQLEFLSNATFHTAQAQKIYGEQLALNLQEQRQKLKKLQKKAEKKTEDKKKSKAQPKRGIETMFRSIYGSHIHLSSIADNKANMMIHINTIIISIMLTVVGAKFSFLGASFKANQRLIIPVISLLLTGLVSIVFAILSAKPKVTEKISSIEELKKKKVSILFFGNYSNLSMQDFENQMKELMKSQDLLYTNMIRDLYFLGIVLNKKYKLLRYSYTSFMIGLIATVALALFIILYLKEKF